MTTDLHKVTINDTNSSHNVWWCNRRSEWRWTLIWEDGSLIGSTHMHSGKAPTEGKARDDLANTIMWIEAKWPSEEYFEGA
jgi:hypothetical protein